MVLINREDCVQCATDHGERITEKAHGFNRGKYEGCMDISFPSHPNTKNGLPSPWSVAHRTPTPYMSKEIIPSPWSVAHRTPL